jgi:hydroxyacylglutathione hydrolase
MVYDEKLAEAAWLIGCQKTGEAIVIDPERDVDRYEKIAAANGLRIVAVGPAPTTAFNRGAGSAPSRWVNTRGEKGPWSEITTPTWRRKRRRSRHKESWASCGEAFCVAYQLRNMPQAR